MEIPEIDLLLRLIIAHLLADFVLQTNKIAGEKKKGVTNPYFWLHILIVGITTYVLLAQWDNWYAPLIIMVLHGFIDWGKIRSNKDTAFLYVADQFLHVLTLVAYWVIINDISWYHLFDGVQNSGFSTKALLFITAYLVVSLPFGYLIGYLTARWQKELDMGQRHDGETKNTVDSLKDAGKWIGVIERVLILTFILNMEWRAVGFLLAAKSVFRIGDLKEARDRKRTEYILIGTLLSFTLAIMLGIATSFLLDIVLSDQ